MMLNSIPDEFAENTCHLEFLGRLLLLFDEFKQNDFYRIVHL